MAIWPKVLGFDPVNPNMMRSGSLSSCAAPTITWIIGKRGWSETTENKKRQRLAHLTGRLTDCVTDLVSHQVRLSLWVHCKRDIIDPIG